jgi:hypothetical protein
MLIVFKAAPVAQPAQVAFACQEIAVKAASARGELILLV